MARLLARLLMGVIFVFVTMTSSMHAHAMPAQSAPFDVSATAHMDMSGMDEDCAKAMAQSAANEHSKTPAGGEQGDDCCDLGCNCPLSHCPATPSGLVSEAVERIDRSSALAPEPAQTVLSSHLVDGLKRPPKA